MQDLVWYRSNSYCDHKNCLNRDVLIVPLLNWKKIESHFETWSSDAQRINLTFVAYSSVANFVRFISAKYYLNWFSFHAVIVKALGVNFFLKHSVVFIRHRCNCRFIIVNFCHCCHTVHVLLLLYSHWRSPFCSLTAALSRAKVLEDNWKCSCELMWTAKSARRLNPLMMWQCKISWAYLDAAAECWYQFLAHMHFVLRVALMRVLSLCVPTKARVSTTSGNLLEYNCSSWKYLYNTSMIKLLSTVKLLGNRLARFINFSYGSYIYLVNKITVISGISDPTR